MCISMLILRAYCLFLKCLLHFYYFKFFIQHIIICFPVLPDSLGGLLSYKASMYMLVARVILKP